MALLLKLVNENFSLNFQLNLANYEESSSAIKVIASPI